MKTKVKIVTIGSVSQIVVECANGHVDWPIQYTDGRVAYDFPERVPEYAKREVEKIYREWSKQ